MTQLGDFRLEAALGSGAMGEVWRARHVVTESEVAIKLLTSVRTRDAAQREGFRDEIHAVAALDHPNVLRIYDYGYATQDSPDGAFDAGTPWFAAELASGDLSSVNVASWSTTRDVIEQILDALAHAHSRGVIHRDLKPQNVLVADESTGLRVKLADFGIAERYRTERDFESSRSRGSASGTPSFMPPEQFHGHWRDYGPATDLYALGCLTYMLLTGEPPFVAKSAVALAIKHIQEPPPALRPRFDAPAGIARWIELLLTKDYSGRPQTAAEAAWRLRELVGEREAHHAPLERAEATDDFTTIPRGFGSDAGPTLAVFDTVPLHGAIPKSRSGPRVDTRSRVPIPADWRARSFDPSATQVEIGLNLAAIREPPFVHREHARDQLWQTLVNAASDGETRVVWLHGARGMGKTRLARWLCDRGSELGATTSFWLNHDSWWESGESISKMLDQALRTTGMSPADVYERLRERWGSGYDVGAAVELLRPSMESDKQSDHNRTTFASRIERFQAVASVLRRLADGRLPVLVVDDAHWSSTALALIRVLRDLEPSAPGFVVIATSDDHAIEPAGHVGSKVLATTLVAPGALELVLEPFSPGEQRDLICAMLPLDGHTAAAIESDTAGVPLHAVQAVAARLDNGEFQRKRSGPFFRRETSTPSAGMLDVIRERLDALDRLWPGAFEALQVAAAAGMRILRDDWHAVARSLEVPTPIELEDMLLVRRLAVADRNGWSFAHSDIRDCVVECARADGRWAEMNRAWASIVDGEASAEAAERKARLLLDGEQFDEAVGYLLRACQAHYRRDDYGTTSALLDELDRALDAGEAPEADERRGPPLILRARVALVSGAAEASRVATAAALETARRYGWRAIEAQACELDGRLAINLDGEVELALAAYEAGLQAAAQTDDRLVEARIFEGIAFIHVHHYGDAQTAREHLGRAREIFDKHGDERDIVNLQLEEAIVLRLEGDLDGARAHLEECCERFERAGYKYVQAVASNILGDILRMLGRLDDSVAAYEEGRRLCALIGTSTVESDLNLAIVELLRENYERARTLLEPLEAMFRAEGYAVPLAFTLLSLAPCHIAAGDLDGFDRHWAEIVAIQDSVHVVDPDFATLIRTSADLLWRLGDMERGQRLYAACAQQYEALGDADGLAVARARSVPDT